jgi:hypothetical protein
MPGQSKALLPALQDWDVGEPSPALPEAPAPQEPTVKTAVRARRRTAPELPGPEPARATPETVQKRKRGRPRLDEEEAGRKLLLYVRRHTRRWLRWLESSIEDATDKIVNRTRITRGILTGVERSRLKLDRCSDEHAIASTIEHHLRAGRVLLAAAREANLDLGGLPPKHLAAHIGSLLAANPPPTG